MACNRAGAHLSASPSMPSERNQLRHKAAMCMLNSVRCKSGDFASRQQQTGLSGCAERRVPEPNAGEPAAGVPSGLFRRARLDG